MKIRFGTGEFCLQDNQPLTLAAAPGTIVRCMAGKLWLTVTGEAGDFVLQAGQAKTIVSPGRVVIEGFGAARLRLDTPAASLKCNKLLQAGTGSPAKWSFAAF